MTIIDQDVHDELDAFLYKVDMEGWSYAIENYPPSTLIARSPILQAELAAFKAADDQLSESLITAAIHHGHDPDYVRGVLG